MAISVKCGKCGEGLKAPEKFAGKRVKCPQCGAGVAIPVDEVAVDEVLQELDVETDELRDLDGTRRPVRAARRGKSVSAGGAVELDAEKLSVLKSFRRCAAWCGGLGIVAGILFTCVAISFFVAGLGANAAAAQQVPDFGPRFGPRMGQPGFPQPGFGPGMPGFGQPQPAAQQPINQKIMVGSVLLMIGVLTLVPGIFACLKQGWALWALAVISVLIPLPSVLKGMYPPLIVYVPMLLLAINALRKGSELRRWGVPLSAKG